MTRSLITGEAPVAYAAVSEEGKVPAGYKLTEVGVIPEDWEVKPLSKVLDFRNGVNANKEAYGRGIPFINVLEVISKSHLLASDIPGKVLLPQNLIDSYAIQYGDMLFNRTSETQEEVGLAAVYLGETPVVFGGFVIRGRLISGIEFDSKYIGYAFRAPLIRKQIISRGQGAIRSNIGQADLRQIQAPIPTVAEQQAIAETLSDVDGLIGGQEKLIAKKRAIKTAAMQQLLTGKTRLPGFGEGRGYKQTEVGEIPEDWEVACLKAISSMNGRIGWQGLKQEEFTSNDSEPFLITGMNFKDGKIKWDEVYHIPEKRYEEARNIQLKKGDILMTKDGTIGKLLYIENIPFPEKASLNSHLLVFRPINKSYVPKFMFYQLSGKQFEDYVELNKSGSTFFGITQEAVGGYVAYLPPIEEQQAIATILSDMDREIESLETRLAKTKSLKQGMMQELLTGKTRLV